MNALAEFLKDIPDEVILDALNKVYPDMLKYHMEANGCSLSDEYYEELRKGGEMKFVIS